jgi:predicted transposase YbfD/YdcC
MPHYSTWSRILGQAVEPVEVEAIIGLFFVTAAQESEPKRGSIRLALDGKTLRGTIPLGASRGVHLLAAYLPKQGMVLAQMRVEEKSNEITHAPKLLKQLDLRGVVGSSDAMFDQRALSIQIVQAKGDYLWTVKDNQEGLREEIDVLFQPHRKLAGTSALPTDFRTARTVEKGHGRMDTRPLTVSSMLADTALGRNSRRCSNSKAREPMHLAPRKRRCAMASPVCPPLWPMPTDYWHSLESIGRSK